MDFSALRTQILANMDNYNEQEMKVVIVKLMDFLVDMSEKRSKLEEENHQLFLEKEKQPELSEGNRDRFNDVLEKASVESKKIIETAELEAQKRAHEILVHAKEEGETLFNASLEKAKEIVNKIKTTDDEAKLYRSHILSIFRKAIFRFSDSNYYIIRSDDEDFRELLTFFEVDEKLQRLCDVNIEKLQNLTTYQELREQVINHPEIGEMVEIKSMLNDQDKINETKIEEIEAHLVEEMVFEEEAVSSPVIPEPNSKKFLEIINKYKKAK